MKLQSEGIAALLSMYADDDEDDIDAVSQGTVRFFIPSAQATPQSSDQHGESQPEAMDYTATELVDVPENVEVVLDNFLPPPPKYKCSHELQEKIVKFLTLKKTTGRSFNAEVRKRKEYRNPDFLVHAVTYQDIDQIGTCFGKDVFDPHGYDKSDFYDEIGQTNTFDSVVREGRSNKKSKWDKVF